MKNYVIAGIIALGLFAAMFGSSQTWQKKQVETPVVTQQTAPPATEAPPTQGETEAKEEKTTWKKFLEGWDAPENEKRATDAGVKAAGLGDDTPVSIKKNGTILVQIERVPDERKGKIKFATTIYGGGFLIAHDVDAKFCVEYYAKFKELR